MASARILKALLSLDEVAGVHVSDTDPRFFHAWNYDRKRRLYIDLTFDQFEGEPDRAAVTILPDDTRHLIRTQEDTKTQRMWRPNRDAYMHLHMVMEHLREELYKNDFMRTPDGVCLY